MMYVLLRRYTGLVFPFIVMFLIISSAGNSHAQDDLSVLSRWRHYSDVENALYNLIDSEAQEHLAKRRDHIAGLRTTAQWEGYRAEIREKLAAAFGPLPAKTPLKARITGTFEHEGIHVENIIYESRPGFHVSSAMFRRSDLKGRLPVMIYVSGHTSDGYRAAAYQQLILNFARKGFAVFAIDPIAQGERVQYWDPDEKKSVIGGSTSEHSYAGLQYLLTGRTMAMVRLWDCIRAVDYVCGRDDIDSSKIGVHGRSGGGTMSSFLGAMDDRITAAAPECYITNFSRLFQSIGPQDGEQNLLSQISTGLDHGDFLIARAPKPTLVVTTTRDFFSIQGARETVNSVKPAFKALGGENNIGIVEDDAPHQSTKLNREAVYAFFMNAFNIDSPVADVDIPAIDAEKLRVSETGQVNTSGSRNIYDLISEDAVDVRNALDSRRSNRSDRQADSLRDKAIALSGYRSPAGNTESVFTGRFQRDGYSIEKYILTGEGKLPIPSLVFVPEGSGRKQAVLYVSQNGKSNPDEMPLIESLVGQGNIVMSIDLPGFGETVGSTHNDDSVINGVSYNLVFGAQLIGRSVTGIQAGFITSAANYLASRDDVLQSGIQAVSRGVTGPALMHTAAFDKTLSGAAFLQSPTSWASLIDHRLYDQSIGATSVPSALLDYDLPDLVGLISPRKILFVDAVGGDGKPFGNKHDTLSTPKAVVYETSSGQKSLSQILTNWLR